MKEPYLTYLHWFFLIQLKFVIYIVFFPFTLLHGLNLFQGFDASSPSSSSGATSHHRQGCDHVDGSGVFPI